MHIRNIHNNPYPFKELCSANPLLKNFVFVNNHNTSTLDFSNQQAVLELNRALLKWYYKVDLWSIPKGYLCPPIPGRADYIHHIADILKEGQLEKPIKGLDIGVGANCIYPILGSQIYNWKMVGCDIDTQAVASAKQNVSNNVKLKTEIDIRQQGDKANIFEGIIRTDEYFSFTMCNPPFHASEAEANKGTIRKLKNLGIPINRELNFGGMANELWCNGGEALFLKRMIKESVSFKNRVHYFTSLVSKSEHLPKLEKQLTKLKATYFTVPMAQGHKKSRILVWKF
ncbi:23S rRNA (adenine(1618)-N(6))-methyltransferase RlmF [Cellulophaga sp. F20128]|uniref:23S rRNA (adenine(1618)-N(6))-methyltransferase RlmF n=1 Tax=Cellulophaga sp. F20128 TaxID=2926413 RepID=UPI001FF5718C|nr:23S rRNA (adenine(1618)-N(6))-methyltransferase RlmF [Cellulophaga sp. F20128]MCK0156751.1 23S rRNA (adenine(1618)-N(6))-methyltransferase RlmF [Cellulophaga sp. F20128]